MKKKLALAAPFVITLSTFACDPADEKPPVVPIPHTPDNPPAVNDPPVAPTATDTPPTVQDPPKQSGAPIDCMSQGARLQPSRTAGQCHCFYSGNPPRSSHDFDCPAAPGQPVIPSKP